MRIAVVFALLLAAGCKEETAQSSGMSNLLANPDGTVEACFYQATTYRNGLADCCETDYDYRATSVDADGTAHTGAPTDGCLGQTVPAGASFRIALPDGGALVVTGSDVRSDDAAGKTRWTTPISFGATEERSVLGAGGDAAFFADPSYVDKLDLADGTLVWSTAIEGF